MIRIKISHSKDKQFLLFAIFFLIIKLVLMKDVTIYAITTAFADDQLMVHIAEKLLRLNWLGGYNHYTLAKGCFFPFFLAVGKFFHIDFICTDFLCTFVLPIFESHSTSDLFSMDDLSFLPANAF